MKGSKSLSGLLVICGVIGMIVGIEILFFPVTFYSESGITIGENISLMNELRAFGGSLLVCGIVIVLGVFISALRFTAILLSTLLYLSYGLSRLYSMTVDGMPHNLLTYSAAIEIVLGLVCAFALTKHSSHS